MSLLSLLFLSLFFLKFSIRCIEFVSNYLKLKEDYNMIMNQYKYENCYMDVFTGLKVDCEKLTEEFINEASYKLTLCSLDKLGIKIPVCDVENNIRECIKELRGDLWTSFSSFRTQITNICFYYDIQKWENSFNVLFNTMINSSNSILHSIYQSSLLSNEIINTHKLFFNELNNNFTGAINYFKQIESLTDKYNNSQKLFDEVIENLGKKLNQKETGGYFSSVLNVNFLFYKEVDLIGSVKFYGTLFLIVILLNAFSTLSHRHLLYLAFIIIEVAVRYYSNSFFFNSKIIQFVRIGHYFSLVFYFLSSLKFDRFHNKTPCFSYQNYSDMRKILQKTPEWVYRNAKSIGDKFKEKVIDSFSPGH